MKYLKQSFGEKLFSIFNHVFLTIISLGAIYPFINVFMSSLSSKKAIETGSVFLWPVEFSFDSYRKVINMEHIWTGYANTVFYTLVGTAVSLFITICGAYPLSKTRLAGRRIISFFVTATMFVNAGLIPTYLNIRSLHLMNTRTAIIIAFSCSAFYVLLLVNYFKSIPDSLEESAKIDGANDLRILWKIILPLSTPAVATLALFYAVERWNSWFWASIILSDSNKLPLQVYLRKMVASLTPSDEIKKLVDTTSVSYQTVLYAAIMVSTIPIILAYPFIQRFFVKGIMLGSVKE